MHSFALYQIVAVIASMALVTLPTAEALPVRGALGNLGARARAAKRAAAHHHTTAPVAEKRMDEMNNAAPAALVESAIPEASTSTALPVNSKTFAKRIVQLGSQIKMTNPKAFQRANQVVVEVSSSSASSSSPSSASSSSASASSIIATIIATINEADVYAAAIAALDAADASTTSTSTTAEAAVTSAVHINAVVPSSSASSSAFVDAQAIYESYVAAMNAVPTASAATTTTTSSSYWATYTPSSSSPIKH